MVALAGEGQVIFVWKLAQPRLLKSNVDGFDLKERDVGTVETMVFCRQMDEWKNQEKAKRTREVLPFGVEGADDGVAFARALDFSI